MDRYEPVVLDTMNPPCIPGINDKIVDLEIALENLIDDYKYLPGTAGPQDAASEQLPRQAPDCLLLFAHDKRYAVVRIADEFTAELHPNGKTLGATTLYRVTSDSEERPGHAVIVQRETDLLNDELVYDPLYFCFVALA